jgi:nitrate reductase gamma subunit
MYEFVSGPLAWLAFAVFFVGIVVRLVMYVRGLDWKLDRVTYGVNTAYGVRGAVRSILFWLMPFGSHGWRANPMFTVFVFVMHIGLIATPLFLLGHNLLLQERWGVSGWSMPAPLADAMTVAVLVSIAMLALRRIALPEVRIVTSAYDYLMLAIAAAPFVTGLIARYAYAQSEAWLIVHILSGELFLVAIPLTKLSHFVLFFATRAQLGMDYGIKRGGMKSKGINW